MKHIYTNETDPTHKEGMILIDACEAGDIMLALQQAYYVSRDKGYTATADLQKKLWGEYRKLFDDLKDY